jgi:hypothetical protein
MTLTAKDDAVGVHDTFIIAVDVRIEAGHSQ